MLAAHTACNGLRKNLTVGELPTPRISASQILIEVHASSVNPLDWKVYKGIRYLPVNNIVPGHDVAGIVRQVGSAVKNFQAGDEVYSCLPGLIGGAYAELVKVPVKAVALKPGNISMQEAAATPLAALTAWQAFKLAKLKKNDSVLIIGASGGVGTYAVQIAKALGAEVTGVCSTGNLDLVRSLGADHVIDYTRESIHELKKRFQVVFDVIGHENLHSCRNIIDATGHFVTTNPGPRSLLEISIDKVSFSGSRQHASLVSMRPSSQDLNDITALIEAGKIKPVIDRQFDLSELDKAYQYSQQGHAKGKIVINLR